MKSFKITFGTGKDRFNQSISMERREAALLAVRTSAAQKFGGYTETRALGGWVNDQGTLVEEVSVVVGVFAEGPEKVVEVADLAGFLLGQDSVVVTHPDNSVQFITVAHDEEKEVA